MSAQLEDGFTRIANELFDAIMCAGFSSRQLLVVLAVIRKTYGYNKKSDDIGLSQLAALTGLAKTHAGATVRELVEMNVLSRTDGTHAHSLGLNKRHSQWVTKSVTPPVTKTVTPVTKSVTVPESVMGGDQISHSGVTESVPEGCPNRSPQKTSLKTTPKDNSKRQEVVAIFEYWQKVMNSPRSVLDQNRQGLIERALKLYSAKDLGKAIRGCSKSPHNMGENEQRTKFNGLELILRNAEKIDRFIALDAGTARAANETMAQKNERAMREFLGETDANTFEMER